ncbi:SMC-Scp complex subunit ScpB [Yunchengibacter salinarum]|uniref:SMC-Scp complex subunit ScpB n=1 Tax=Yunchengibacter salinarum TaxID=3133399 RepID=UPI0035B62DD9
MTDSSDRLDLDVPGPETSRERWFEARRMVEAILFATDRPLSLPEIAARLPGGVDVQALVDSVRADHEGRGFELAQAGGKWFFRTAEDMGFLLRQTVEEPRRLSRAAVETLAIIAYHQPVTRAEIEQIRGVTTSKGSLDVLMEAGWLRPRGRRKTPGRPMTFGTTDAFLAHFSLNDINDLPGLEDLRAAGLLESVEDALTAIGGAAAGSDSRQIDLEEAIMDTTRAAGDARRAQETVRDPVNDPVGEDELEFRHGGNEDG